MSVINGSECQTRSDQLDYLETILRSPKHPIYPPLFPFFSHYLNYEKTWQTKLCTNITSFLQQVSNEMTWCILIGCPYGPVIYSPEKLTVGYINQKATNAFKNIFFLTKEKNNMFFTYIFETDNFFFSQDTNLLLIQNTYHHQMAVVPWESRYNSETTLTLISVCLLFTLFPTHFS